ncbi:hypothetical protein HGRIS_005669 [Hohenbuehelia grisea]
MLASSSSRMLRLQRTLSKPALRTYHDLVTTPTNKPVVSHGPPGYSAVSGHVATVFGCTGFLGRYLVAKLAKMGTQVIIPYRDEDEKRHLKLTGDLGQVVAMEWDIRNEQQIAECLRHSDVVYNLVGRNYNTKNFDIADVHVDGAQRIARIAAEAGVSNLVHVSHLNASASSTSRFYATKARGEEVVREAFPAATIVRPGPLYGYEDKFLNNMADWPIWWKLNEGQTKTRPAHVMDVAQALANLISKPHLAGSLLSLPGPSILTHEYLLHLIDTVTLRPPSGAPIVPKKLAEVISKVAQNVWWPIVSPDEIERRYIDDAGTDGSQTEEELLKDWDLVEVHPSEIEAHALTYLRRFRSA